MKMEKFEVKTEDIKAGKITDVYFKNTAATLKYEFQNKLLEPETKVVLEVSQCLPKNYRFGVMCGVDEILDLFRNRKVDIYGMKDGDIFFRGNPVMRIEATAGEYAEFADLETPVLGLLGRESGIATKSARVRIAAKDKTYLFFGTRNDHPFMTRVLDKAAFVGGADGISNIASQELLGLVARGTMPHALMIINKDQEKAWKAYAKTIKNNGLIVLADTFWDEKAEALLAAKLFGQQLKGVRLDTTGSRRGDFREIVKEVRWELDIRGYKNVGIFCSGGMDEFTVAEVADIAMGFGVGSSVAGGQNLDATLKVVEVGGEPISKRGKKAGAKQVWRKENFQDAVTLANDAVPGAKPLLEPLMLNGEILEWNKTETEWINEANQRFMGNLGKMPEEMKILEKE